MARMLQLIASVAILILILIVVQVQVQVEANEQLLVGNEMGWTNYDRRSFKVPNYGAWAASHKVLLGDQIVFKYTRGLHNVNLLPNRAAYKSCDFSKARVLDAGESGVFVWNASRVGIYYFGCNKEVEEEGNHCGSGQKLSLAVLMPTPAHASLLVIDALSPQASASDAQSARATFSISLLMAFPMLRILLPLMHPQIL